MAMVDDDDTELDEPQLGEVPAGLQSDLYSKRLETLSRDEEFGEGVLSFRDEAGSEQEIPLDEVAGTEHDAGSNRTKILLRNGAIVVATGAVIAGALAAIRYRRKHKG
jgi:hypothetical protein